VRDTPGHCEFHSVDCSVGGCAAGALACGHKERGGPHTQRPTPHIPGTVFGAASHRYPELHGRCRRDEKSSTTYMVPVGTFISALPARSFRFWCPA